MIIVRRMLLFLCLAMALSARADLNRQPETPSPSAVEAAKTGAQTNKVYSWAPGKNDARIASTAATMLEQFHYLHLPFDASTSSKMLDLYLDTLDPQHLH